MQMRFSSLQLSRHETLHDKLLGNNFNSFIQQRNEHRYDLQVRKFRF